MNIIKHILLFISLITLSGLSSKLWAQEFVVFGPDSNEIAYMEGFTLKDAKSRSPIFTIKGNLVFDGESDDRSDIFLMVNVKDLFSKTKGTVEKKEDGSTLLTIARGGIFLDKTILPEDLNLLAFLSQQDSLLVFRNGEDKSLLGFIQGIIPTNAEIIATFYLFFASKNLEEVVKNRLKKAGQKQTASRFGKIGKYWGGDLYNEWVWNGKELKPKWGNRIEDIWHFDGEKIEPYHFIGYQYDWTWDGKTLKRIWGSGVRDEWVWDGQTLRPFWDASLDDEWVFDENQFRPAWNYDVDDIWVIEGDVPLPLIFIVVLGIADRR